MGWTNFGGNLRFSFLFVSFCFRSWVLRGGWSWGQMMMGVEYCWRWGVRDGRRMTLTDIPEMKPFYDGSLLRGAGWQRHDK